MTNTVYSWNSVPDASPPLLVITMTGNDGLQHYVTDDAAVQGRRAGRYVTVCGREIVAASLCAPDGVTCSSCASWGGRWSS